VFLVAKQSPNDATSHRSADRKELPIEMRSSRRQRLRRSNGCRFGKVRARRLGGVIGKKLDQEAPLPGLGRVRREKVDDKCVRENGDRPTHVLREMVSSSVASPFVLPCDARHHLFRDWRQEALVEFRPETEDVEIRQGTVAWDCAHEHVEPGEEHDA